MQFEDAPIDLMVRPGVRTASQVTKVVKEAAAQHAIIFYTLVSENTRQVMQDAAHDNIVEAVDVFGPVMSGLNSIIHRRTRARPGWYYISEKGHFERIDAIDYTLKHDDGQRLHELGQADVVLVGVSRASKSSTCFYLAYRGIRAANVPILPDVDVPPQLKALDPRRVIGLTVNHNRLLAIREARLHSMGVDEIERYTDDRAITHELRWALQQMSKHNWNRIDVSYMAIEEIAKQVMHLFHETKLRRRPRKRRAHDEHMRRGHTTGID